MPLFLYGKGCEALRTPARRRSLTEDAARSVRHGDDVGRYATTRYYEKDWITPQGIGPQLGALVSFGPESCELAKTLSRQSS